MKHEEGKVWYDESEKHIYGWICAVYGAILMAIVLLLLHTLKLL